MTFSKLLDEFVKVRDRHTGRSAMDSDARIKNLEIVVQAMLEKMSDIEARLNNSMFV